MSNMYFSLLVILIIGIIIIWTMLKLGIHYYGILLIVFIFLGAAAYVTADIVKEPIKDISSMNQTINGTYYQVGQTISIRCDEGFVFRLNTGDCYNPSPFGHWILTLFGMLAGVFGFSAISQSTFLAWRTYLSPKTKFYKDEYQKDNKDIPRNINVYRSGDYTWMWGGYGRLFVTQNNELYISHNSTISKVGENYLFKGGRIQITPKALLYYLKGDVKLFHEILGKNASIVKNKIRLSADDTETIKINIPVPLTEEENKTFLSKKGNYDVGVNRFKKSAALNLFKMRKAITLLKMVKTGTMTSTLTTGVTLAEKSGIILNEVNKGRNEEVIKHTNNQYERPTENERYGG